MGKTKQAGNQLQIGRENMPIFTMQEEKLFAPEVFAEQVQQLTEQVQQSVAIIKRKCRIRLHCIGKKQRK